MTLFCTTMEQHPAEPAGDYVSSLHVAAREGNMERARLLLDAGADPNATDYEGWTPLYLAVYNGRTEFAKLLLEAGADPTDYKEDTSETGSSSDE